MKLGRRSTVAVAAVAALASAASAASAVQPKPNGSYSGKVEDYLNNAPSWHGATKVPVSFKVSANRRRLTNFKGRYVYYCGAGTATVTAAFINVSNSGSFDYRFKQRAQAGGYTYVEIKGHFTSAGKGAEVSYLVDYDGGRTLAQPYSTANPAALGCASWVHGNIRIA